MTKKQKSFRFNETTIQMLNLITQTNKLYKDNTHTLENLIVKAFLQELERNPSLLDNLNDIHPDILRLTRLSLDWNKEPQSTKKPEV